MILRSTDLEVETIYNFGIEENINIEPILVESSEISSLIKNYPSENITLEFQDEELKIEGDNISATIPTKKDSNYPEQIDISGTESKTIYFSLIKQAIETVVNSSSQDAGSKMGGVNIKTNGKEVSVAATDGFRLALYKMYLDEELDMNFTISKKCAQEITKFDVVSLMSYQTDSHWILSTNDKTIAVKKLNYEYPNYEKAIPTDNKYKVAINREDFIKKLLFASSQSELVKLIIKDNVLTVQSSDTRINTKIDIRTITEIADIEFTFKSQYLISGLRFFDAEDVLFTYKDNNDKPITIENEVKTGYVNILYITMPTRPER